MNELKQDSPLQILSPAGDLEAAIAAIEAGADAIYIGLPHFNARKRATNINFKELKIEEKIKKSDLTVKPLKLVFMSATVNINKLFANKQLFKV